MPQVASGDLAEEVITSLSSGRSRVSSQACDPCRVRKTKCDNSEDRSAIIAARSTHYLDGSPSSREEGQPPCKRCVRLGLTCTFLLPSGVRGPRRKNKQAISSSPDTVSTATASRSERVSESRRSDFSSPPRSHVLVQSPRSIIGQHISPILDHTPAASSSHLQQTTSPQSLHTHMSPTEASYPTDDLCDRATLRLILHDYLEYIYPMIPVVHRPSFQKDLARNRDIYDKDFLGLIVGLCAVTVGTMPSRFQEYRSLETPISFETRTDMINYCYQRLIGLRGHDYFDEINLQKWAASYLISISSFQIGQQNRARMMEVEHCQLARLLDLHQISRYEGLNCIEVQLRKKAFWLMFYTYVHSQLQNFRKERLVYLDETIMNTLNLEELMLLEVDDEQILETTVLRQPAQSTSLAAGFNVHSRVFWAALTSSRPRHSPNSERQYYCNCVRAADPVLQLAHLRSRLDDLKYMLDGIPSQLRQWVTAEDDNETWLADSSSSENRRILRSQFASMRANIHVTHLWLQSIIHDQIYALSLPPKSYGDSGSVPPPPEPKQGWAEREDICRQLLHVLHGIAEINLEANGHHLTCKVRDVAVTLLACPFEGSDDAVAVRAHEYLLAFRNKLSRLDRSETVNTVSLQSWVDTDRMVWD